MNIVEYAKSHPWATGIIVVVGGIVFIALSGWFGGGSSGGSAPSGPSDAEVMANAQIAAAQIQANAQAAQAGAAIQAAQIGAGVQLNSDNKAAEVALAQITAAKDLGITQTTADKDAYTAMINAQRDVGLAQVNADRDIVVSQVNASTTQQQSLLAQLPYLKKKNRDEALQAIATGVPVSGGPPNYGNSAAGIISSIGGAAGNFAKAFAMFSDQRLKENIVLVGQDRKGNNVYEYNYKGSKKRRRGYIAQDIARSHPEAVHMDSSGYYKVDVLELASI